MRKKVVLILATAGLLAGLGSAPAFADATDIGGAVLSNTLDMANAALGNTDALLQDPNTTCKVTAIGDVLVQRTNAVVADVHAEDLVSAIGSCVSLASGSYSGRVTVTDQYYVASSATTGTWVSSGCGTTTTANSVAGVLQPLPASAVCTFAFPSPALNRYHRAMAVLTNSRGQTFSDLSPVWFLTP